MKEDDRELSQQDIESISGGASWYAATMHFFNPSMPACHYDNNCTYQMTGVKG